MLWPALLTGPLLWAAFFPLDLGPLAFVALVPWLTLVRAPTTRRRRYLFAYLGGLAFFLLALQWIRVAHPMMYGSWLALALACPVFWCVSLFVLRRIDRLGRVPFALSVPVVWVAAEYARAHFPTGFSFLQGTGFFQPVGFGWYFLGYTQHAALPLIQIADVGGVYAVSFLVAAVNGAVFEKCVRVPAVRRWLKWDAEPRPTLARIVPATAGVAALVGGALLYGFKALDHTPFVDGPRVAAIQGSVPQLDKSKKGDLLFDTYYGLFDKAVAIAPRPDLVVWPETCCPFDWCQLGDGVKADEPDAPFLEWGNKNLAALYGRHKPLNTLYGLNGLVWEGGRKWRYNSAVLLDAAGRPAGRYDKMHLVPFGEYVPFRETFPFMQTFTPYKDDYSCRPGEHWTRFPLSTGGRTFTFGCVICYEDSDPYLARQYVRADPVDFLVNISNDGWFDGTEEHEQHLAICRFRAVEARRSIVRAVNMGVSCVIDPDGRVVALPAETVAASVKTEGVVSAAVPLNDGVRGSWYAAWGDWLPAACWALVAAGVVGAAFVRRR